MDCKTYLLMCQLRLVSHGQPGFSTFWATVARFFAVEPWCHCQLGRRAGAADVKGGESFSSFQTCRLVSFFLTIRVTCNSFGVRPMKMCELDSPSSPAARPPPPQPTRCARPPSFHPGLSQPILLLIVLVFAACPPQIQP